MIARDMTNSIQKIINKILSQPQKRREIFYNQPLKIQAQIILKLTRHIQYDILQDTSNEKIADLLENMDSDEATDVIQLFTPEKQKALLKEVEGKIKGDISLLLRFDPETAGGMMNLNYIQVDSHQSIAEVAKLFKIYERKTGHLPAIIVSEKGRMIGYLPGHELGFAKPGEKAKKYVHRIQEISHLATREEAAEIFRNYPHNKLVVTGENGKVIGIIYSDDVLKFLHEEESKSLYDFAGVSEEEGVLDRAKTKIKFRYKWLIANLATSFLAAFTVGLFNETISKYVLLAVYMPIVAGMGGNAATQTLAVLVRGITLKQISLSTAWKTLRNEVASGFINGLINGVLVASVVMIVNGDAKIAIILGLAMIINLVVAGIFGTIVPLIMQKLKKDPASSTTIFITTATDVLGFLVFLGLATIILK